MSATTSTTMRRVKRASDRVTAGITGWSRAIAKLKATRATDVSPATGRHAIAQGTAQRRDAGHPLLLRTAWALVALLALGLLSRADAHSADTPNFTIEYHHADLSGNIRLTTDEYGAVVREAIHLPFGERDTGECGTLEDGARPLGYQGKPRDPKTCLDDFGARHYRAAIGRFQTVDPVLPVDRALRDPQQWNRYAYARNNPLIYTDPDGRFIVPALILAVGAVLTYEFVVEAPPTTGPSFEGDRGSLSGLILHTFDRSLSSGRRAPTATRSGDQRPLPQPGQSTGTGVGSIYKVPGTATASGKPYIGRHNKPEPPKTRRSTDGRDRTQATVIDTYDASKPSEGRAREQAAIDAEGGIPNLDNKRNEIRKR